jgi:glycerol-3-phosphate dehydrogenase
MVVLNAQEVVKHGGEVRTRTRVTRAWREGGLWMVEAEDVDTGKTFTWQAKGLVNAAGPWVKQLFDDSLKLKSPYGIRLIKGSHIVVPRVHTEKQAYILQNEDNRIVFVIPWMDEFSIIGTTDVEYKGDPKSVHIDDSETEYLLKVFNGHFKKQLTADDIVWSYSGVRPLCDDESDSPQAITRDYTLDVRDDNGQAPLLSVFGGKLTTYRKPGPKTACCRAVISTAPAMITRSACVVVIRSSLKTWRATSHALTAAALKPCWRVRKVWTIWVRTSVTTSMRRSYATWCSMNGYVSLTMLSGVVPNRVCG